MGFWHSLWWYWTDRLRDLIDRAADIIYRDWGNHIDT